MGTAAGGGTGRIRPQKCGCGAAHFTGRELEVLLQIASGKTSRAAAVTLGIKPGTVTEHIGNMKAKAGVRKRAELIIMAIAQGILVIEDSGVRWGGRACIRPAARRPGSRGARTMTGQPRPSAPCVTCHTPQPPVLKGELRPTPADPPGRA